MANVKISQLPALTTLNGTDVLPVVNGSTTYKVSAANIATYTTNNVTFNNTTISSSLADSSINITLDTGNATLAQNVFLSVANDINGYSYTGLEWTDNATATFSETANTQYMWVDSSGGHISTNDFAGNTYTWDFNSNGLTGFPAGISVPDVSYFGNAYVYGQLNIGGLVQNRIPYVSSGNGLISTTSNLLYTSGNATLSTVNVKASGALTANGITTLGDSIYFTNYGNIQGAGNVYANFFVGDGRYLSNVGGTPTQIVNGTSTVNIPTSNGNVTITAGSANWNFGTDTTLTIPGGIAQGTGSDFYWNAPNSGAPNYYGSWNLNWGEQGANSVGATFQMNKNNLLLGTGNIPINISSNGSNWQFGNDGNLTLPTNTSSINYANGQPYGASSGSSYGDSNVVSLLEAYGSNNISSIANIDASAYLLNSNAVSVGSVIAVPGTKGAANKLVISSADGEADGTSGISIDIISGNANGAANGGSIEIQCGLGSASYGEIGINRLGGLTVIGGQLTINGTDLVAASANAQLAGILTDNYYYGNGTPVTFGGGSSLGNLQAFGNVIYAPASPTSTGFVNFDTGSQMSLGTNTNLPVSIVTNLTGNVAQTWTFGTDGNLTLPGNTVSINYANGAPYGGSSGGSSLGNLTATGNVIYANNSGNVSGFVNFDDSSVMLIGTSQAGNILIATNTSGNTKNWTFATSGTTVLPAIVTSLGVGEAQVFVGTRTIVGGLTVDVPYSTVLAAGGNPTVAYLSSPGVASTKITFAVQSSGAGFQWEQFDVVATASQDVVGAVNFVVSNRVKGTSTIGDTVVTATMNGSQIEISLTLDAVQTSGGTSSFSAVEFALMID